MHKLDDVEARRLTNEHIVTKHGFGSSSPGHAILGNNNNNCSTFTGVLQIKQLLTGTCTVNSKWAARR